MTVQPASTRLSHRTRVVLRPLDATDEMLYCDLYTDSNTMRLIGPPLTLARAKGSFRAALRGMAGYANGRRFYAIVETATQTRVGLCGQQPPDQASSRAEIGIMLTAQARASGYSIEAFAAMLDITFSALPIDTIWVQYHPANMAADRLCTRLGFWPCAEDACNGTAPSNIVRSIHRRVHDRSDTVNTPGEDQCRT